MTDEELLYSLGLTPEEVDEMSALGYEINKLGNVTAIAELTQLYLDAGLADEAERVFALMSDAITSMQEDIFSATGINAAYNDTIYSGVGGWYNTETGQFLGKMSFDRNLSDDGYMQAIRDQIGMMG